jgi:RimJ/RimL family protein N-acetyltransferase
LETKRLSIRPLRAEDVEGGDGVPSWYGDEARRRHFWSPDMPASEYLRGLASTCDMKRYFAFLFSLRETGEKVGLVNVQLALDGERVLLVLSLLVGSTDHAGQRLGVEASGAVVWLLLHHIPISHLSLRISADNETSIRLAEGFGYTRYGTVPALTSASGAEVLDYRIVKERWLERNQDRTCNVEIVAFDSI